MARYSSVEEVSAALVELEEHDRAAASERPGGERHSDGESQKASRGGGATAAAAAANGRSPANGAGEDGRAQEEDSESYSDSGSADQEGQEDEEDAYEDKTEDGSVSDADDEGEAGAAGSDEDEDVQIRQKAAEIDPREAAEFDRELRALMQESLESRKLDLRARPTLNMMVPMNVFDGARDPRAAAAADGESGEETVDEDGGSHGGSRVRVKVLVKKGNKQQTRQMFIPGDCSLVQSTRQKEAEELEEKQSIKRRILEYNEREEEESNGVLGQMGSWAPAGGSGGRSAGRGVWDGSARQAARHRHQLPGGASHGYSRKR